MAKRVVVLGAAGALGRGIVRKFQQAKGKTWKAFAVDFTKNEEASSSFVLQADANNALSQAKDVSSHLDKTLPSGEADAIICAAGGWTGGSLKEAESLVNVNAMYTKNVESAVMAAHLAVNHLKPGGLLVVTGAAAALKATPDMVAYGMSKAATHHLIASTSKSLPSGAAAYGVLPITIDTPMNRKHMPSADHSSWTKIEDIAAKVLEWAEAPPAQRPPSGHLFVVSTSHNKSKWKDMGSPFLE